ncbi:hypothetical protein T484DRAFT_1914552, partial [Baffinella frigidus]
MAAISAPGSAGWGGALRTHLRVCSSMNERERERPLLIPPSSVPSQRVYVAGVSAPGSAGWGGALRARLAAAVPRMLWGGGEADCTTSGSGSGSRSGSEQGELSDGDDSEVDQFFEDGEEDESAPATNFVPFSPLRQLAARPSYLTPQSDAKAASRARGSDMQSVGGGTPGVGFITGGGVHNLIDEARNLSGTLGGGGGGGVGGESGRTG